MIFCEIKEYYAMKLNYKKIDDFVNIFYIIFTVDINIFLNVVPITPLQYNTAF